MELQFPGRRRVPLPRSRRPKDLSLRVVTIAIASSRLCLGGSLLPHPAESLDRLHRARESTMSIIPRPFSHVQVWYHRIHCNGTVNMGYLTDRTASVNSETSRSIAFISSDHVIQTIIAVEGFRWDPGKAALSFGFLFRRLEQGFPGHLSN